MRRECSECHKSSLQINLFDENKRIRCFSVKCTAQYEIISVYKFMAHLISSLLLFLSFYLSLAFQSWVIFICVGIIIPIFIQYLLVTKGELKLVGLKAELKKKLEKQ